MTKYVVFIALILMLGHFNGISQNTVSGTLYTEYSSSFVGCGNTQNPSTNTVITLMDGMTPIASTTTDMFGNFSFSNIPDGYYTVITNNSSEVHNCTQSMPMSIDVFGNTTNLELFEFICDIASSQYPYCVQPHVVSFDYFNHILTIGLLDTSCFMSSFCETYQYYGYYGCWSQPTGFNEFTIDLPAGMVVDILGVNAIQNSSAGQWNINYNLSGEITGITIQGLGWSNLPKLEVILKLHPNYTDNYYYLPMFADMATYEPSCPPAFSNPFNYSLYVNPYRIFQSHVAGHCYQDIDNDCNFIFPDPYVSGIKITVRDANNNVLGTTYSTDFDNNFSNYVVAFPSIYQSNSNNIYVENFLPYLECPTSGFHNINDFDLNFGFADSICNYYDISGINPACMGLVFPGQTHIFKPLINNQFKCHPNTINVNGTIKVKCTGPISFVGTAPGCIAPTSVNNIANGYEFIYTITDFSAPSVDSLGLQFLVSTTAQIGDAISYQIEIHTTPNDIDLTNNQISGSYFVVNSYDPNIKIVDKTEVLPGYNDWLYYTIYFQNTGNAPAINIAIYDTLSHLLQFDTFEYLGSSHKNIIQLWDSLLKVSYMDIFLPDSASEPQNSVGYFAFRIKPKANIPNGTLLSDNAAIFFDYNPAVITNFANTLFTTPTSTANTNLTQESLALFPNPNHGKFNLHISNLDNHQNYQFIIHNLLGNVVYERNITNVTQLKENIHLNLPSSVYFYELKTVSKGTILSGKLVID